MASFQKYKTKQGTLWLFKTYVGIDPKTGKRKPTTRRGFKTKKEAQEAARILEDEVKAGIYHRNNLTFKQVFDEWWSSHKNTIKLSTQHAKLSKFDKHILPWFGNIKMRDITKQYCQHFVDDLSQKINSVADVKIQANLVFKYALKHDYITRSPMQYVEIPKKDEEDIIEEGEVKNFWTKDELDKFLSLGLKHMTTQNYVYFYMLAYTGMRKGELIALEWKDVNFESSTIRINKTLFFKGGKEIIQTTKKYASRRTISIDEDTLKLLRKWKIKQKEIFLSDGVTENIINLFTREDLRPLRLAMPNDILKSFIKKHKLKEITVHGLRHTHASILFEAGATIKEVQERLGHKEIETTMNVYTHVSKFVAKKTANTFSDYMKKI
ncbi:site-specific integrase [Siminovitchia terrae]|uniref:site-specific integrase n=1 Tax=Siminovitchia terrae TaxID=1914933 RepID=UPI0028B1417A|nr:site-specific integrase [Siminovitchia terrae]